MIVRSVYDRLQQFFWAVVRPMAYCRTIDRICCKRSHDSGVVAAGRIWTLNTFKIQKRPLATDSIAFGRTTDRTTVAQRCTTCCNSSHHLMVCNVSGWGHATVVRALATDCMQSCNVVRSNTFLLCLNLGWRILRARAFTMIVRPACDWLQQRF